MRQTILGPLPETPRNIMRRIGYGEHQGRDGVFSYTKRIQGGMYPRYHGYIEERGNGMQINLHLDQKQASYEGSHAHSGEYEGPTVEREMARIVKLIEQLKSSGPIVARSKPASEEPKKKSFWDVLWG